MEFIRVAPNGPPASVLSNMVPVHPACCAQRFKGSVLEVKNLWVPWMARRHTTQQDFLQFVKCGQRRRVAVEHSPRQATAVQIVQRSRIVQNGGRRFPAGLVPSGLPYDFAEAHDGQPAWVIWLVGCLIPLIRNIIQSSEPRWKTTIMGFGRIIEKARSTYKMARNTTYRLVLSKDNLSLIASYGV